MTVIHLDHVTHIVQVVTVKHASAHCQVHIEAFSHSKVHDVKGYKQCIVKFSRIGMPDVKWDSMDIGPRIKSSSNRLVRV